MKSTKKEAKRNPPAGLTKFPDGSFEAQRAKNWLLKTSPGAKNSSVLTQPLQSSRSIMTYRNQQKLSITFSGRG